MGRSDDRDRSRSPVRNPRRRSYTRSRSPAATASSVRRSRSSEHARSNLRRSRSPVNSHEESAPGPQPTAEESRGSEHEGNQNAAEQFAYAQYYGYDGSWDAYSQYYASWYGQGDQHSEKGKAPQASDPADPTPQRTGAAGSYNPAIHGDYDPNKDYAKITDSHGSEGTVQPEASMPQRTGAAGGYNPAIHGDYDPTKDYAQLNNNQDQVAQGQQQYSNQSWDYAATASFNRFTGAFNNTAIHPTYTPEHHTQYAQSGRQLNAYYDVNSGADQHGGRSLKAERQNKKLSKKELQQYKARNKAKKEEKARSWLYN